MNEKNMLFRLQSSIRKKKKRFHYAFNPKKRLSILLFTLLTFSLEAYRKIVHKNNYVIGPAEFKVFFLNQKDNLNVLKKVILKIRPILFEEKQTSLFETVKVLDRESLIMRSKNQQDHVFYKNT